MVMSPNPKRYGFEGFHLDTIEEKLCYEEKVIPIEPRVFQTLLLLVKNPGRIIEKEEFLETVWKDAVVEEGNLPVAIAKLRKALREKNNSTKFIETVPRKGYRFNKKVILEITELQPPELISIEKVSGLSEAEFFQSLRKKVSGKWILGILILLIVLALSLIWILTITKTPTLKKIEIVSPPDKNRQLFVRLVGENFNPETVRVRVTGLECLENDPCEVPNGALKKWADMSENTLENVPLTLPPGRFQIFTQNGDSEFSNTLILDVP